MKKHLLVLLVSVLTSSSFAQLYYINSTNNGTTINTCRGQVVGSGYSSGMFIGSSGGYGNNQNYTLTVCSGSSDPIRANFYWIDLETGYDYLYVYDGPSTASPLLATLNGSASYPGVYTSSGTCLTFKFVSDGSTRWGGFNALLGCLPKDCGTNSVASDNCGGAPIICNLDGYCGSTSGWYTRDNGGIEGTAWGGSGVFSCGSIQNNSWISFVASATSANFNITSSGCSDPSTGIQAIVLANTACTTFTAKSTCVGNGIGTFALNATGLTVGQTYYIMVDGVDGNDCDYIVQAQSGVQTVNITGAGTTKCVGAAFTLTASASGTGPFTYSWTPAPNSGQGTSVATYSASGSSTYSCIITGACGANQTATYYQYINPSPTVSIAGTQTICSGNSTTLTAASTSTGNITFNNNQNYSIPDNNTTGVTSTISVSGIPGTVGTNLASICLDITHGFDADLDIILTCPGGTTVDLSSDNGGSGDNYTSTCFVNSGTSITLGTAPFTGSFTPEQALSILSGCTANGTWSLTVKDDASLDVGTLTSWTLNFTNGTSYTWSPGTGLSATTGSVVVANPTTTTVYTITGTDMAGCSGNKTVTVTVNPTPTVAVTSTPSNTMCLGSSITFTAATASTYTWTNPPNGGLASTSGANVTATPTATGSLTYTINASSAAGCTTTAVKSITVNPVPTANSGTGGTLTCSTTSLGLSGSGGGTYSWTGPGIVSGSATATPSVNTPGTYSLVVTNSLACSSIPSTVSVSQNTIAPSVTPAVSGILNCTLTSVNASATTTTTPVTYNWSGTGITAGAGTGTVTVNQPGTFNYTVTNTSNGCKTIGSQAVTQNTAVPTVTVPSSQTITCAAPTVTLTGSATPSTCTPVWSGGVSSGANSYTATASSANVYTLTVTNPSNGCTVAATLTVSPSAGLPILNTPAVSNSITCTLSTAQVTLSSTPAGNTYTWTGPGIVSGTNSSVITVSVSGTYSAVVTNTASLCSSSVTAFVPINNTPPTAGASNTTTLTCTTTTAALTGTGGGTYSWAGPGIVSGNTTSSPVVNLPGTYTVTVTSSVNGCTATANTAVSQNTTAPTPGASNTTTLTCTTTTAALTGTGGGTYSWAGPGIVSGSTTSSPVVNLPGTYTVTVTSSVNGCTATANTSVSQNTTAPTPGASNTTTLTCTTTTAALTGTGGGTYSWAGPGIVSGNTTSSPVVNLPGTYTVTVTSSVNGCTATANTSVSQNTTAPTPTATTSGTLTCATSSVTLTGSPSSGLTYQWSGAGLVGATTNSTAVANLAGTYTLLVTSTINSCTNTATTNVGTNYTSPNTTATNSTTLTCSTTTALVTGGPGAGVTYQWSGPGIVGSTNTQTIIVNQPGVYNLVATSAVTGCSNTAQTIIDQDINLPNPSATPSGTLTCSTLTVSIAGTPTTAVTYTWSGPGIVSGTNSQNAVVNAPGNYTLYVTSSVNSCTNVADVTVFQNTVTPTVTGANTGSLNCTVLSVNASATTSATPVSYNWSGAGITAGATTGTITLNQPGTYNYTVTNTTNNCSTTGSQVITQNTVAPTVAGANTGSLNCTVLSVNASATTSATPVSYNWSGAGITAGATTGTITLNQPGTYNYTVTNTANTCSTTGSQVITQNIVAPTVTGANTGSLNCTVLSVNASATTSTTPVSYNWSGAGITAGATTGTITLNQPGTYSYTVTNTTNNCFTTGSQVITQNTVAPTVAGANTGSLNCTVLSVNASATTSATPVSYNWSGAGITAGASTGTITLNQPGTYNYTVTNTANTCSTTGSQVITQNTVAPTVTMPGTQTITCASPSVSLIGSANPSTCTPVWTGGVCAGANSYTTTACSPNTYTLTVTNPFNGCTASGTVSAVASVGVPSVTASNSGSITCTNTSAQITASTTMTPVSYAWTGPSAVTGASSSTGTVSVGGSYQCVVTNTLTGCASTVTTIVPTNTTPVSASVAPTPSITCTTTSLTLSASPTGAYSYSWAPASGLNGNTVSNPTVTLGGTYSVTITNTVNGCFADANVTVPSNTIIPTVLITSPTVTTSCSNPSASLSVSSTPSVGVTYSWTAPGSGSLNTYTVSNPVASGSGVFTVVVTNTASGCSSSATQNTIEVIPDLAIPQTTLSSNSLSITCSTPSPSVSITTTASPVSYSWTPTSGIVSGTETTATPSFTAAGSYSAIVTNTNTGCATSISGNVVDVSLDNTVPTVTLTSGVNNGTLTCSTTSISVTPTISPSSNLTFTWSPSSGLSSSANQSSATFTAAGVYTLAVTNTVNGCVSSNTSTANSFTVIADNTPPTFTLGTAPSVTTTCAAPNATLSASSNADPNSTYTWLTPSSGTLTGNPVSSAAAGIYTVSVTNTVNGCSSSAAAQNTVEVVVDAGIPNVTLSANSVSITCANPTPSVAVSTTATPVSYSWSPTSGIVPGTETTASPSFNAAGSYSVVVTNTNSGCATDVTTNVVTVTLDNTTPVILPFIGAINSGTINCNNQSITASPFISPNTDLTYTWTPTGTGLSTPTNQANATFTAAGVYTLAVTNTLTGCVSILDAASTFTVFVDTLRPAVAIIPTSTNTIIGCGASNATVTLDGSSSTSANPSPVLTWLPNNTSGTLLPVTTSGTYTLVVTDAVNGCSNTAQYFVDGNTTIPTADAGTGANIACGSSSVALNGITTSTNVNYSWSGPSSTSILSGSNTASPIVTETGIYTLTVTDNLTGCQNTATVNVAQANVAASFTANPTSGISPLTVDFTDQSSGASAWNWNFDGINSSNAQNPSNTFTTGTYTVTLTASSGTCSSTATLVIVVEDGLTLEIPNVFTPNGDNINDIFTIKSTGVKEITLQIFNRWGEKLYEFAGAKASWDGITPNGGKAPEATYFYFVKATGYDGKEIEKHGTLNLFR